MESLLSKREQEQLLDLAFQAVETAAAGSEAPSVDTTTLPTRLGQPAATFVTLSLAGALRGCIGTTEIRHPLAEDVVLRARAAATRDPRFPAVSPEEVPNLEIEISILTTPQPLQFANPGQLLLLLKAEKAGVVLKLGQKKATFLPQVWDRVSDVETFLELLCQKASLHRNAWRTENVQIETYRVESFHRKPTVTDEEIGQ